MSIPALSQSKQALLACPHRYCAEVIYGQKQVQGDAARRGNVIHDFLKKYVLHLSASKRSQDGEAFDRLLKGLDPGAREILEPMRDVLTIDPETIYSTEQKIAMTEDFKITPPGLPGAAFEGTIDLILLHEETCATILDFKSQFQAIDAGTFQGKLYSLMLMTLNPEIEQCEFRLEFLRWGRQRSVIYSREMIPGLQDEARRWRERQIVLHSETGKAEALPGPHCAYCQLLCNGCPIEANPYGGIESHLRAAIYHKQAYDKAREILKAHCDAGGPIRAKDGIGQEYEAAWTVTDKKVFNVQVLPVLQAWDKAHRSDPVLPKLTISGLSSLLRAKKRAELADEAANYCDIKTGNKFKIGKAGDDDDDRGDNGDN